MRNTIRLGKLFGIEIGLDLSWLLIFALVTWSMAQQYLTGHPDWSAGLCWSLGLATSLLFFGSVLLHELGHSLVSQAQGIPVPRITLFFFGGVSQISKEPRRARDEFWMALAGPLVSLGLGALFGLIWFMTRMVSSPLAEMAGWLAAINASLAIFNMLPAFPLDGGRVFQAIVWGITGSLQRATRIAVGLGVILSSLMIAVGIWQVLNGDWANGLWIASMGWFLSTAAVQEGEATERQSMLEGHTVREVPLGNCPPVFKQLTLDVFAETVPLWARQPYFAVMDRGQFQGLLPLGRLQEIPLSQWPTTHVAEVMIPTDRLTTVRLDQELSDVLDTMAQADKDQLPVVENGQLLGIVTRGTILAFSRTLTERQKKTPGSRTWVPGAR